MEGAECDGGVDGPVGVDPAVDSDCMHVLGGLGALRDVVEGLDDDGWMQVDPLGQAPCKLARWCVYASPTS